MSMDDKHHNGLEEPCQRTRSIYKDEFIRFCENTTIRGVSKVAKASKTHIRCLWLTFFIFLFIGFVVCIVVLARQYTTYDVHYPFKIYMDKHAPFPSLSVCNLSPLARNFNKIQKQMNIVYPTHFDSIVNWFNAKHYVKRNISMPHLVEIIHMPGYLASLPNGTIHNIGHKEKDLIINCKGMLIDDKTSRIYNCNQFGSWNVIVHKKYINCYTFSYNTLYNGTIDFIELYLYLDQVIVNDICKDCFKGDIETQLSGALIKIHPRSTYPNLNEDVINLQPGTYTKVNLKMFENTMKEPPHGQCSTNTPAEIQIHNQGYVYTEEACRWIQAQRTFNTECGCNTIMYPNDNECLSFCSALPIFLDPIVCSSNLSDQRCIDQMDTAMKRLRCRANVESRYKSTCPYPCKYYSYEHDISIIRWPTKHWQMKWLETETGKPLLSKPELNIYKEAYNLYRSGKIVEAFNILNRQNILEQHILAVRINRRNYNVNNVEQKEVLSLTSFLCQLGGLCSLWIGVTFIIFMEIIEMVINCVARIKFEKGKLWSRKSQIHHSNYVE